MNLGMPEMLFIGLLALVVLGPRRLPELGKQVGKAVAEFKRATNGFSSQLESEVRQLGVGDVARVASPAECQADRTIGSLLNCSPASEAVPSAEQALPLNPS